jgi:TPR repeat protein
LAQHVCSEQIYMRTAPAQPPLGGIREAGGRVSGDRPHASFSARKDRADFEEMEKALDLVEAGSLPHRHSQAVVVVEDVQEAEAELSFFDYQLQSYIGESGLSPQPFFFSARKRTLADGRAGYVVGPEVTRFLRRDARFGVAGREGRLGDVRCKVRTYVEAKDGPISVAFATPPRDGEQREGPEISLDAASPLPSGPFTASIDAGGAESSGKPALDVSTAFKSRKEEPATLGTHVAPDGRQEESTALGVGAQAETSRERAASSTPKAAAPLGEGASPVEAAESAVRWGPAYLAIGLFALLAVALVWPRKPAEVAVTETAPAVSFKSSEADRPAPLTECDRLAASPYDPDRIAGVAGVEFDAIPDDAVAECFSATKAYPLERRLTYQLGRSLAKVKRYGEARNAYAAASTAGSSSAITNFGVMYEKGRGVARDDAEAARLFRKAADMGNARAITNLGVMYERGRGVARDDAEAARLYRKAVDMGDAYAIANLGWMYAEGRGVTRDDAEAVRLYRKAADMGNDDTIVNLGRMYAEGRGVTRNDAEAVRLYRKGADMGNARAITNLGWMYAEGRGVTHDDAEAVRLYRKAADMGDDDAITELGWMYAEGRGVARDDAEAVRLYRKAADMGHEGARTRLDEINALQARKRRR